MRKYNSGIDYLSRSLTTETEYALVHHGFEENLDDKTYVVQEHDDLIHRLNE